MDVQYFFKEIGWPKICLSEKALSLEPNAPVALVAKQKRLQKAP
jgi:hypothetical protein